MRRIVFAFAVCLALISPSGMALDLTLRVDQNVRTDSPATYNVAVSGVPSSEAINTFVLGPLEDPFDLGPFPSSTFERNLTEAQLLDVLVGEWRIIDNREPLPAEYSFEIGPIEPPSLQRIDGFQIVSPASDLVVLNGGEFDVQLDPGTLLPGVAASQSRGRRIGNSGSLDLELIEGELFSPEQRIRVTSTSAEEERDFELSYFRGFDLSDLTVVSDLTRIDDGVDDREPPTFAASYRVFTPEVRIQIVSELPLPGDYNDDGFVGQSDLDLVLLNFGDVTLPDGFNPAALPDGEPFDNLIGQNELDAVLLNFGSGTPTSLSAVPETTSGIVLGLLGVYSLAIRRRS